jgi:hypothetical protein
MLTADAKSRRKRSEGEQKMAYNATNAKEIETLPADEVLQGIITNISDGKVKDFVKNTENWKGDINGPAIEANIEVTYNGNKYDFNQLFTYSEENGKTAFSPLSNLGKYSKKYGKLPEVGDQVKCMTKADGFLKLKLE